MLTNNKHPHIPDQIIELCLWRFDSYDAAIAANPLSGASDHIRWDSLTHDLPIASFNPSTAFLAPETHSVQVRQDASGWFYWQLEREDDHKAMAQIYQNYAL